MPVIEAFPADVNTSTAPPPAPPRRSGDFGGCLVCDTENRRIVTVSPAGSGGADAAALVGAGPGT